ncbi:E3 SUMO-protein ligase ZBED1-like [Girardinichthys multiradiatus]|uniref:E3 SUMO-protein ligase ZBED1-like n=1 Tax=Girardinichthys multiradiatus TaxID=208333 RepID=UPI001FADD490|nr:E3 SUMO-protein ligase ZBED1-like [Girardinichthys multiradiatus]
MEEHVRVVGPMNGKFTFQKHPDGTIDKGRVICLICKKEFAYHRSSSSLAYHINAKHPVASAAATVNVSSKDISNLASHSKALHQTKLEENTPRMSKFATDRLTNVLAKWIALNCRPINIVEDKGLTEVLQTASNDPSYKPPSRSTLTTKIGKMYDGEKKNKLEILVNDSPNYVAITGDQWTSAGNHSYLGVTGHFIDGEWNLNSFALTVMKTETRHFADKCVEQFLKVVHDWGIENKISTIGTDNAANMLAAMRTLPYEHIACNAHLLQRTITVCLDSSGFAGVLAKCPKIVGHFKQSPASTTELNQQQVALGKKSEQLVQDVPTRWNSTLAMVSRLLCNREAIQATLDQQNHRLVMPNEAEWGKLQRLEVLLEPCRYLTDLLGGEAYVSCSVVLPAFCHLDRVMDITDDDPAYVVKFKNAFQRDLAARRADANETWFKLATALDPRFKDLKCLPREKREQVWTSLENMLQAAEPRREATLQPSTEYDEPAQKKRRSVLLLGSDSDSEEDGMMSGELQRYRGEPSISIDDCPLQWWYAHSGAYGKLSALARKYLASPATSIPCERPFNLAGHVVQKKRAALLPENVTKLVCLSDWLKKKK